MKIPIIYHGNIYYLVCLLPTVEKNGVHNIEKHDGETHI
jgi:hypothetical protein